MHTTFTLYHDLRPTHYFLNASKAHNLCPIHDPCPVFGSFQISQAHRSGSLLDARDVSGLSVSSLQALLLKLHARTVKLRRSRVRDPDGEFPGQSFVLSGQPQTPLSPTLRLALGTQRGLT